ncbi:MAG: hypothetical protein EZS28_011766 [Streblomastix strix]|uniref:Uncharacterized protein n=2 Tax=Streblomastix strix TaxID=222440 RepID=A0A5J4WEJ5_9EUKA|nr:MAG: hypothetical protein EZS28_011766 [Streblomastix strix]
MEIRQLIQSEVEDLHGIIETHRSDTKDSGYGALFKSAVHIHSALFLDSSIQFILVCLQPQFMNQIL